MAPWVFSPDRGGVRVPEAVRRDTETRIRRCAQAEYAGRYTRLDIRFRAQFCYIDAYREPEPLGPDWPPPELGETREEHMERLRNTPTHLARLRYFGREDAWGYGFYSYGSNSYKLSVLPSGEFFGMPEDAFRTSANVYL